MTPPPISNVMQYVMQYVMQCVMQACQLGIDATAHLERLETGLEAGAGTGCATRRGQRLA